ncbi:MAG TPA: hypothetical protein VGI39_19720 [Polyangiaceae bacterium]|jgi:uncharacterized membrane protein YphA (DoxX/SURF4 family)
MAPRASASSLEPSFDRDSGERSAAREITLPAPAAPWTLTERIAFRFLFVYLALFFFPLPSGLADPEWLSEVFDPVWHRVVPWFGAHLLHLTITTFTNGSGDTTYDWVRILCMALIAVVTTGIWSVLDRRRPHYRALLDWARIWLRYALAITMLTYGLVKVVKLQFPDPSYGRLTETFGQSSPMGLLWTFMGYSAGYTFFAGASEVLGALLLFFRRTTTLGALVVAGVMSNVVLLNFCYDVPVKLGSSHLLFGGVVLLIPDLRRLVDFLVLNRPTLPVALGPHPSNAWVRRGAVGLKVLVIGAAIGTQLWQALDAGAQRSKPIPPEGWYALSSFVLDGQNVSNEHAWTTFGLRRGYVRVWLPDHSSRAFKVDGDAAHGDVALLPTGDDYEPVKGAPPVGRIKLDVAADGKATLSGTFEGHTVAATMARKNVEDFPLMKRGFHWISERPFNE